MRRVSRFQVATTVTALFVGGIVAGGLASRDGGAEGGGSASAAPEVIHKRKVRTVNVPAGSPATGSSPAVVATPVSAPAVSPVSSRTSPGGGAAGDDEGERSEGSEVERGESD